MKKRKEYRVKIAVAYEKNVFIGCDYLIGNEQGSTTDPDKMKQIKQKIKSYLENKKLLED